MSLQTNENPGSEILDLNFIGGDKLAGYLVRTLNWSSTKTALIVYASALSLSVLLALSGGRLLPGAGYTGLLVDYFYFISETALVPVIWGYYVWIYRAPDRVYKALIQTNIINPGEKELSESKKILHERWPVLFSLLLGLIFGGLYYSQGRLSASLTPHWLNTTPLIQAIRSFLVIAPTGYVTWSIVLRLINNARVFKRLLSRVSLHPLHPDNAGGLRPLGQYALRTTYLIALAGSIVALAEYLTYTIGDFSTAYFYHLALSLYLILAPLSFFAPLWAAHDAMKQAKEALLLDIATQFKHDFSVAHGELKGTATELKDNIEKIEQLQKLHHLTASFPVWPFDTQTLRRFLLTMSSPVVTILVSIAIEMLTKLLLK